MVPHEQDGAQVGFKSRQVKLLSSGGKRVKGLAPCCSGLRVEKAAERCGSLPTMDEPKHEQAWLHRRRWFPHASADTSEQSNERRRVESQLTRR